MQDNAVKEARSRWWYVAVAVVVFLIADNLFYLTGYLDLKRFMPPRAVGGLRNLVQIALCFVGIYVAHRVGLKAAARELGMLMPIGRGFVFAFIASLPMLLVFGRISAINPNMTALSVGVGCILAPLAEEILFRAYLFRQLYRRGRLGFWISALIPTLFFAAGHLYQSTDLWDLIGIAAITGLGSLLFCWIFIRWCDNLWPIFFLHSLMNLWWEVFGIDDSALGGWIANGSRLGTVAVAIILTFYRDRIWNPLPSELQNTDTPGGAINTQEPA